MPSRPRPTTGATRSCIANSDENFERELHHLNLIRAQRCDGLILTPTGDSEIYRSAGINSFSMPSVLIDRVLDAWPVDSVTLDNVSAAMQATKYIIDLGHRRIGTISGPAHVSTGADRLAGFLKALSAHGLSPDPSHMRSGDFREDVAYSATREVLAVKNRPTALYVANNQMLVGVMRAITEAGFTCPPTSRWSRRMISPGARRSARGSRRCVSRCARWGLKRCASLSTASCAGPTNRRSGSCCSPR